MSDEWPAADKLAQLSLSGPAPEPGIPAPLPSGTIAPAPGDPSESEDIFEFQKLLLQQQSENAALLAHLDAPAPASAAAAAPSPRSTDDPSPAPPRVGTSTQPHSFVESSAPDDDLIPPSDPVAAHASVRDAAVRLLHAHIAAGVWEHLQDLADSLEGDFEGLARQLWEGEAIRGGGGGSSDGAAAGDSDTEPVREANGQKWDSSAMVQAFVERERRAALKLGLEEMRLDLLRVARLETQVSISAVLLEVRSDSDLVLSDNDQSSATAVHVQKRLDAETGARKAELAPEALKLVDMQGRVAVDRLSLPPIAVPAAGPAATA